MAVLRTAQAFGFGGGEQRRLRAIGPAQPAQRGFVGRAPVGQRTGEDPAVALDHHRARLAQRCSDQRDPRIGQLYTLLSKALLSLEW